MQPARDFSYYVRSTNDLAHLDLAVEGVNCAGCMSKIERALSAIPDVTRARVNLTSGRVAIEWKPGVIKPVEFIDRLAQIGYKAHPFAPLEAEVEEQQQSGFLLRCLGVAAFAAMNIMMLSIPVWSGNVSDMLAEQRDFFHWLAAMVALPAAAYAGRPFFISAYRALRARTTNMDVPISIGVIIALGMSLAETINHAEHAYFDAALMLLTFLLAGRFLDQNMRRRTRAVAGNLAALKAEVATKFISENEIAVVPIAAVLPGDMILVRPGERIAVDGVVVSGLSEVDQSLITGETRYHLADIDTKVYAGTLNISDTLRIRSLAAADSTLLADITKLLDNSLQVRSRYVRLADRASRLYAPIVHATAFLTMIGWVAVGASWHDAIVTAVAVLIITCPCALGLAIPAVQTVAAGALFRSGVLLNSGDAIERAARVSHVVFDKTGTLTNPELEVQNAAEIPRDVLALAGRLALASHHPMAAAIVRATSSNAPIVDAKEIPGEGVCAIIDGVEIKLGKPEFCGVDDVRSQSLMSSDPENSVVVFSCANEKYLLAIRQRIRPDAHKVISALKRRKITFEILSGDREEAVKFAANALGIDCWRSGLTPTEKISRVQELKREGAHVMMVGDGLNDAPALAAGNVSMSPITATHLSQATADMVFLGQELAPVVAAIDFSRKSYRLMQQNLWLAVVYNLLAVPIAIAGSATPLVAALAMSGSSVLVMLNAWRGGYVDGES